MSKKKPQRRAPAKRDFPAERQTSAKDRYVVDIGGVKRTHAFGFEDIDPSTAHRVIVDTVTGERDARPGMSESRVNAEVARLNKGLPVSPVSQGIGRKPRKLKDGLALTAAEWVELLMIRPETAPVLQDAAKTGRKLSPGDVRRLMTFHERIEGAPPGGSEWLRLPTALLTPQQDNRAVRIENLQLKKQREAEIAKRWDDDLAKAQSAEDRLILAVAKQLNRTVGVQPKDGRNVARSAKRKANRIE